jgi:hypothetical protein
VRYPRSKSGQLCQSGSEFGARCALSAGHGGDAGGWRPAQGRRENGARGFSELGADRGRCEGSRERFAVCSRHEVRGRWWQGDVWLEVLSDSSVQGLDEGTADRLAKQILSTDEEQDALRERIAALAPAILPKGVGAIAQRSISITR